MWKAIVHMKKTWVSVWLKKPGKDEVMEALADEILSGKIDDLFEIVLVETEEKF